MLDRKCKELEEIMSIDINNLARRQYDAYRLYVIDILTKITNDIRNEKYDYIKVCNSPAGDCHGTDTDNIDFEGYGCLDEDMGGIILRLKTLEAKVPKQKQVCRMPACLNEKPF